MKIPTLKNTSRKPYIYKVTNLETGQYYIGSQCSGKTVGVNYFTSSTNKEFKEGFKTYGGEKYNIVIIKEFEDPDECGRVENYMIRDHMQLKDGLCLNRMCRCGNEKIFSTVGTHHSEETRKKMSIAKKGRPTWNKGVPWSEETRKKLSETHKGTHLSEEAKHKVSISKKGTHHSEETRKKMSIAKKGHPAWNKGIPQSEEAKEKISRVKKGIPSPRRIKISIEDVAFESITEASKYYNVSPSTISSWVKTKKHNTKKHNTKKHKEFS